jgi:hypothetical protein
MLAARCTQNAYGKRFQRSRFGAQFAQALIEFVKLSILQMMKTQFKKAEFRKNFLYHSSGFQSPMIFRKGSGGGFHEEFQGPCMPGMQ